MRYAILIGCLAAQAIIVSPACAQVPAPSFQKQVIDDAISIGYGLAISDVDGDGKPDIVLADKRQIVWYRNGDWKKLLIAENLTESDNVCIAAADIDGDGKAEIAVGAQWNPGETTDSTKSGAVFYLVPPHDRIGNWVPVKLPHEPTVHRMKWVKADDGQPYLVVAPLHGRGNKDGVGKGARLIAYQFPKDINSPWQLTTLDSSLHLTHNFSPLYGESAIVSGIYIASKEGIHFKHIGPASRTQPSGMLPLQILTKASYGAGELAFGKGPGSKTLLATIEPMHGNRVVVYEGGQAGPERLVLDSSLKEGHALGVANLMALETDQVIAGWRQPDAQGKTGIRIYYRLNARAGWQTGWIDENGIAPEDLQIADLNNDGKPEVIAAGRATKNVVIYWNKH